MIINAVPIQSKSFIKLTVKSISFTLYFMFSRSKIATVIS